MLIIIGFAIAYTKLEAKVETDKLLLAKDVEYLKASISNLGNKIDDLQRDLKSFQNNQKLQR